MLDSAGQKVDPRGVAQLVTRAGGQAVWFYREPCDPAIDVLISQANWAFDISTRRIAVVRSTAELVTFRLVRPEDPDDRVRRAMDQPSGL